MDTLTSVIAGRVYGLNLKDLPLDRLSEQKHKKRRHLLGSKNKLNAADRAKMAPSPSVQESKPEVASSSAAPVAVVPSTSVKTAEPAKTEGNTAVVPDNMDKSGIRRKLSSGSFSMNLLLSGANLDVYAVASLIIFFGGGGSDSCIRVQEVIVQNRIYEYML